MVLIESLSTHRTREVLLTTMRLHMARLGLVVLQLLVANIARQQRLVLAASARTSSAAPTWVLRVLLGAIQSKRMRRAECLAA